MTGALDRTPLNTNFLQADGFIIVVKKLPTVKFFTQEINIPEINLPPTEQPNPFTQIPIGGDHIEFGDLMLSFKVDEDMRNYIEIYNWIQGIGYPDDHSQYKALEDIPLITGEGLYSDISILITTNLKNPNIEIVYRDAFPISLSGFNLSTVDAQSTEVTTTCRFKYLKYDIFVLPK